MSCVADWAPYRRLARCIALLVMLPVLVGAQETSAPDLLDSVLREVLRFRTDEGTPLVPRERLIIVDLTGLDSALATLGVDRRFDADELAKRHPGLELAPSNEVFSCLAGLRRQRCVLPAGVTFVRFFSPRTSGTDVVSFRLGAYHRMRDARDDGTRGLVYDVRMRRWPSGWRIMSATPVNDW
jgi:hypothetical protein